MTDDIETLREFITRKLLVNCVTDADDALAALERVASERSSLQEWSTARAKVLEQLALAEAERDALRDADLVPRSLLAEANLEMASVCAEKLRAKDEKLRKAREALEPFAYVADHDIGESETDNDIFRPMSGGHNIAPLLTVGDLRRAQTALAEIEKVL